MRFCVAAVQVRAGPGTLTSHGARTPGSDPVPGSIPGHLKAPSDDDGDDAEWGKEAGAGLGAGAVGSTKLMVRLRNVPFEVPPPPLPPPSCSEGRNRAAEPPPQAAGGLLLRGSKRGTLRNARLRCVITAARAGKRSCGEARVAERGGQDGCSGADIRKGTMNYENVKDDRVPGLFISTAVLTEPDTHLQYKANQSFVSSNI